MESNGVNLAISSLIFYHHIFVFLLLPVFIFNLFNTFFEKNYAKLNKKIWFCMPLIFLLLSITFLIGISIWAMLGFEFSWRIVAMLIILFVILVCEIRRKNLLKTARISESGMRSYVKFCKLLYSIESIILIIAMGILGAKF